MMAQGEEAGEGGYRHTVRFWLKTRTVALVSESTYSASGQFANATKILLVHKQPSMSRDRSASQTHKRRRINEGHLTEGLRVD